MANEPKKNLFTRLTTLFRTGPVIRRKVKNFNEPNASSAYELFRKNISDVYSSTISAYGAFDRMSRYSDFSEMEATPELASALDIYAEETASQDDTGRVLHIYSEDRIVRDLLNNLFYDILNVDFNLPMWVRNLCKYGDFFLFMDVNPQYGVVNAYPIPIAEIEREEGYDPKDPMAVRFRWITRGNTVLENWQVTHFRLLGNDAFLPYGASVLESARRIWRQLILIEDAMLVYRIVRAPERRVFYVDVGNVPPEEIENYMQQAQTSLKRNQVVDKATGKMDLRYNPMSSLDDYFIPVRGGESGTKIDTLAGGQNAAAIEDVQYIQKKLFAAIKIPKAYLGYDEEIGAKATLAQEDIRFSRTISRIQKVVISELNKIAMIHLYSHGIEGEELLNFTLALNNPSSVAQLQKLELIKTKFEIAGAAPEGAVDRSWIRKNILGLTDEDIVKIKDGRKADKIEDADIEKTGQEQPDATGGDTSLASDSPPTDAGGSDTGGDDAGGGDTEDLFAGDFKVGSLIGEDDGLPIKASQSLTNEKKNVFGGNVGRKKRDMASRKAHIPDFKRMTLDDRPQSTKNNPFDTPFAGGDVDDDLGTSLLETLLDDKQSVKPNRTSEFDSALRSFGTSIGRKAARGVISENDDSRDNDEE